MLCQDYGYIVSRYVMTVKKKLFCSFEPAPETTVNGQFSRIWSSIFATERIMFLSLSFCENMHVYLYIFNKQLSLW